MTTSGSNWQLWRQDDNGHRFLVGTYPTKEAAESRLAELMVGHHKQTYWVSKEMENKLITKSEHEEGASPTAGGNL